MNAIFYICTLLSFVICIVITATYFNSKVKVIKEEVQKQKQLLYSLVDEVTSSIDVKVQKEIDEKIRELKDKEGSELSQVKEDYKNILDKLRRM